MTEKINFDIDVEHMHEMIFISYDRRLNLEYTEALRELDDDAERWTGLSEVPTAEAKERIARLEVKLKEYSQRVKDKYSINEYEEFSGAFIGGLYKRDILRLVLKEGEVSFEALLKAYGRIDNEVNYGRLVNAFGVIEDYIRTGGKHVRGGRI